jgi:hypothetical protein
MDFGALRHRLANQFDRGKFEMARETFIEQMQHQRQRRERDERDPNGWIEKRHI